MYSKLLDDKDGEINLYYILQKKEELNSRWEIYLLLKDLENAKSEDIFSSKISN